MLNGTAYHSVGVARMNPRRLPLGARRPSPPLGPQRHGRDATRTGTQAGFSGGANRDPFASSPPSAKPAVQSPVGFRRDGRDASGLPSVEEADKLLAQFDTDCEEAVERDQAGLGFISEARERELQEKHPQIRYACEALASSSLSVMMGICAPSAADGVTTLKEWVSGMGLPRGRLHGMDNNGVAIPVKGAVFIKYNSASGDADLSGYTGGFRGVLLTPTLADGAFRQYGYLPLSTFHEDN